MEARTVKALLLTSLVAAMAFFPAASPASASDCPASIAPVSGGYGNADTKGFDDGTPGNEPLWGPGQIVVSLKRSAATAELRCVARELKAEILDGEKSSEGLAGMRNTMVLQLRPGISVAGTMRLLEQRRYENLVRYASPNYEIAPKVGPTDEPLYPIQWGLTNQKTVPKKTASESVIQEINDPNTSAERKADLESRYMIVRNTQAPFLDADRLLAPGTFAQGRMPFSIQAARAWSKMPKDSLFSVSLGPGRANVVVIDSGIARHYELDRALDDRSRIFRLDGNGYQVTVKPGATGGYRLRGTKTGLGKFLTCPIDVAATPAQVESWMNRLGVLCGSDQIVTVGFRIEADSGFFTVRTATGRIATRIPWNVEPEQFAEYLRRQLGLGKDDVDIRLQGRQFPNLRMMAVSFPKAVYDREGFVFDDSQLKDGANPGRILSVPLALDEFTVTAPPAPAPNVPAATWTYQVDTRDGLEMELTRDLAYADKIASPARSGGVSRSKPATKWLGDAIGHGTFVSGVIAADPLNGQGMTGVVNNRRANLSGAVAVDGTVTMAAAITHAAETLNADVVNISLNWGTSRIFTTDPPLPRPKSIANADPIVSDPAADAIGRVTNTGTLFVVAAGNESVNVFDDGPETDPVLQRNDRLRQEGRLDEIERPGFAPYPCRPKNGGRKSVLQMPDGTYDRGNILCVGSSDWYGQPSNFTNWGTGVVDLAAPGENIVGPDASDGQSFKIQDGTSFSAPIVAGIATLVKQKYPGINEASIVKCAILSSATTRPLVISGLDFGTQWQRPFKAYADRNLLGDEPGKLPVSKKVFTVTGMAQADEALSAAGSLWSRYRKAVRKNTARPKCVQQRKGSFWGKGKWVDAPLLGAGY